MNKNTKFACIGMILSLSACGGGNSSSSTSTQTTGSGSTTTTPSTYTVGGSVSGLGSAQMTLAIGGGNSATVSVAADGTFTFPATLTSGASYAVTVQTQPSTPGELCNVSNSNGSVSSSNVTNITVSCKTVSGFLYELAGNQIYSYRIDPGTGTPVAFGQPVVPPTPSSGTALWSGLTASPAGDYLYVDGSSTDGQVNGSLMIYSVNHGTGALTAIGTPMATGVETNVAAVSSNGLVFIYAANGFRVLDPGTPAGSPTVQEYSVNTDGTLSLSSTQLTYAPNSSTKLAVTPDGKFLYTLTNSPANTTPQTLTLTTYDITASTGALTSQASLNVGDIDLSMAMDPLGRFLYLTSETGTLFQASAVVLPYAIDSSTGSLTAIGTGTAVQSNVGLFLPDPSGISLFVANNLNASAAQDSLQALTVDPAGNVSVNGPVMQTTPSGSQPSQLLSESTGRYVYLVSAYSQTSGGTVTNSTLLSTFSVSTADGTAGQLVSTGSPISLSSTSAVIAYVPGSASGG